MCGIAGWIDFERDLSREGAVAEAMNEALACRGPDGRGVWVDRHAVLGHTRNAVIDIPGGGQPMAVESDGRTVAAISYSGEIYNYRELKKELESYGHRFRSNCDTEVALRAYLQWGLASAEHLVGMFAFGVWDPREQRLVLIRDHMGIKPLHFARVAEGVVFGSEPKALFASGRISPAVNADGLRELFCQSKTPGVSVFTGVQEVKPGHVVVITRGGLTEHCYWRIESRPHTDDLATTVSTIRELLTESVASQLVADVPVGILLSGGLDSSVITALAERDRRRRGADPLPTFSLDFAGYTENFQPDEVRDTPDGPYAWEMARHAGTEHREILLDPGTMMDPEVRRTTMRCQDLPTPMGDGDASIYLVSREVRKRATVVLSGETADEVFGGFNWVHSPQLVYAETFPWVAIGQLVDPTWPGLGAGLLDKGLLAKLDIAGATADRYRDALAEVPHLPGEQGHERRMRELLHLHLTRWLPVLFDRTDRLAMAAALEIRVPFCDHRLIDYVFNTPWAMKSFDGREKSLLRAAAGDLVPRSVLERRKSPYPVTQDPRYARLLCAEFDRLLADRDAPVAPLFDAAAARQVTADPDELATGMGAWVQRGNVEMILQLDAWLRDYDVRVSL
ncbi:asparagine synthetase B [Micromonospora rosaria]|uniref:asparagine synthase (glutamine-hydrolyzing) n=1 Tax=Micromonospora rosaria TaxID=47874 RepID=A0A136PZS8_9ACTN|nr:asparagine synthase (glutamine-hydrolyzing) [Micromonospora rosaria]KXK63814.1 asparagine synthetase B [Micromonospora rosaria]